MLARLVLSEARRKTVFRASILVSGSCILSLALQSQSLSSHGIHCASAFFFMCAQLCPTVRYSVDCNVDEAPLSMGFPRREYWGGLPFSSPGDLADPGTEPGSLVSPALAGGFLTTVPPRKPRFPSYVQFSSVAQSCPTLCNPMNCTMPGLPVHHQLPEFTQPHVHRVGDALQPSHPLLSPFPPALNPSQHQSLFQ